MRPQYTINDYLYEIWPLDGWSRKVILNLIESHNVVYTEEFTTMGTTSFRFDKTTYLAMKSHLDEVVLEQ